MADIPPHTGRDSDRILVVDDEPSIRRIVSRTLQEAGYIVLAVPDRAGAIAALADQRFNLAILDVQLPDANGLDLCDEMAREHKIPVIMLTVVVDESDIVRALESGADDYVRKPFSTRELTARVASVLRRAQPDAAQPMVSSGPLQLDARSYRAQAGGEVVPVTPTEFRLLALLVQRAGQVLTHDELLQHVWGTEYTGEHHMLHVTISRLRQKLARVQESGTIRTQPGVGYEFVSGPS